jgi:hypothetical protein
LLSITAGQKVISKHKNGRFYQCEVVRLTTETFYEVNFDDGSFSDNLYPEDIVVMSESGFWQHFGSGTSSCYCRLDDCGLFACPWSVSKQKEPLFPGSLSRKSGHAGALSFPEEFRGVSVPCSPLKYAYISDQIISNSI